MILKKAEAKYKKIVKQMQAAQKDLDKEVAKKIILAKKHEILTFSKSQYSLIFHTIFY